ncbi:hypothetical protein MMC22_001403 [Lobaria immixta]|nr:hypothetical protein [Lobaria immixta]
MSYIIPNSEGPVDFSRAVAYFEDLLGEDDFDDEEDDDEEEDSEENEEDEGNGADGVVDEDPWEATDHPLEEDLESPVHPQNQDGLPRSSIPTAVDAHGSSEVGAVSNELQTPLRDSSQIATPLSSVLQRQKITKQPVDLRSLEYVGSYDHNLMCAICHCPFVEPARLDYAHMQKKAVPKSYRVVQFKIMLIATVSTLRLNVHRMNAHLLCNGKMQRSNGVFTLWFVANTAKFRLWSGIWDHIRPFAASAQFHAHTANPQCPMATLKATLNLVPKLASPAPQPHMANDRLAAHETALNHLRHKNSLLETSLITIQETLNAPSNLIETAPSLSTPSPEDNSPFDSTAHHLLCMHESLREEVGRVSAAVSELDAKASMMVMNESLRTKEELAHTNAAVGGMRMHLHWLMSARLQNQQRGGMLRTGEPELGVGPSGTGGFARELGPSVRRLSDSTRQDTKL